MLKGRCLCGAVRYEAAGAPVYVFNCYCATCRRETGAGHATIIVTPKEGFTLSGDVKVVAPAREGGAAPIPRTFCPACGTTLFAQSDAAYVNLRAGTVEGVFELAIEADEFAEQAQPWDLPAPR